MLKIEFELRRKTEMAIKLKPLADRLVVLPILSEEITKGVMFLAEPVKEMRL